MMDCVRSRPGRDGGRFGGDDDRMPVDDVGTGVGYCRLEEARTPPVGALWMRLLGLGGSLEDHNPVGSNGGSN